MSSFYDTPLPSTTRKALASLAAAPATDGLFTADERVAIFSAAYDSAFEISLIRNIAKKSSSPRMFTNYAMFSAPDMASKGASRAITAAMKLKTKHLGGSRKHLAFDIKPFIAKQALSAEVAKADKLADEADVTLFKTLRSIGVMTLNH